MSLKLQCWFYKSQIMFCKTKGSWSSTWKQRFSDSSRGRFFSFPSTDSVCLGGEREAQTCVDRVRLLGKSTYLEGKQCLTKNTASVFTWLIPRWASLHPPLLCSNIRSEAHVEACWSQMLSKLQPSYAGAENKILARGVPEPRLLRRAGDTYQGSRE